ncbi:MAG: uncharacterized protein QOK43_2785 [Acidimicrobiaceae bacterium]|nr:uncharacterized protein [Acidimicrobiaceae bacterium]
MRTPADFPARRRTQGRARVWLVGAVVLVVLLVTWLRGIAGFYTTYLWFQELHFTQVWRTMLGTKGMLATGFTVLFFVALWLSLAIADRIAPRFRLAGDDELVARYRETVGPHAGKVRVVVAALFALLVGTSAGGQWQNWLLFRHGVSFGTKDPQFHKDIGFYVFKLPFLGFLVNWVFVALVMIAVVTLVAHYLNGGIRLQAPGQRVTPAVKAHVSVLLGAMALVKAAGYYLQRFELMSSRSGVVDGPTYTVIHARLPALTLLSVISLVAFALFVVNIRRQGWVLPVIAVGLWAFINVVVGSLVPAFIQKFRVEPSEIQRERAYIQRNIKATQAAMGIQGVAPDQYEYTTSLTADDLNENSETIRNIRLWDPSLSDINTTYQKLQEIRGYYSFEDIDVDRYTIDGRVTQAIVSVRELNAAELPGKSFVNRRLQFTHGYGAVVSPANAVTADGKPEFVVKDVPPVSTAPEITIAQPRIYYGESDSGYAIVGTKQAELDFQAQSGQTKTSQYEGAGGVPMNSLPRKAAFALRFGDMNPLISGLVTSKSRVMYVRSIGARVREAAPFLRYDADPYPVLVGGRIKWVQDAFTTTSRYPYAQRATVDRLEDRSGLKTDFNYVRNSVKAVIDAYDGTVTFYVIDDTDPMARAYRKMFPNLFTAGSQMPQELREHLRYPEDLFRVQTSMYGRYHINDPSDFYLRADEWDLSQDPGSGDPTKELRQIQQRDPRTGVVSGSGRAARMDPTYVLMRLPHEQQERFLILQPFVFHSEGDKQQNLSAFVTAKSDPGPDYGKLQAFVMPRDIQVDGPLLVHARMLSNSAVSEAISLLGRTSSEVRMGNLLVLPIGDSLLYVRPMYVLASANKVPELQRVIVVSGTKVVMGRTLSEALTLSFGSAPPTLEEDRSGVDGVTPGPSPPQPGVGGPAPNATVQQLLDQAQAAYDAAKAALAKGDLGEYQRQVNLMADLINRARTSSGAGGAGGGAGGGGAGASGGGA